HVAQADRVEQHALRLCFLEDTRVRELTRRVVAVGQKDDRLATLDAPELAERGMERVVERRRAQGFRAADRLLEQRLIRGQLLEEEDLVVEIDDERPILRAERLDERRRGLVDLG